MKFVSSVEGILVLVLLSPRILSCPDVSALRKTLVEVLLHFVSRVEGILVLVLLSSRILSCPDVSALRKTLGEILLQVLRTRAEITVVNLTCVITNSTGKISRQKYIDDVCRISEFFLNKNSQVRGQAGM